MSESIKYRAELTPDTNGTIRISFPDVPGANSFGNDEADALARGAEALETMLEALIANKRRVPPPSKGPGPYVSVPEHLARKINGARMAIVERHEVEFYETLPPELRTALTQGRDLHDAIMRVFGRSLSLDGRHSKDVARTVLALVARSLKTFRSIHLLASVGQDADALALLRGLFETSTAIEWILTGDPDVRTHTLWAAQQGVFIWPASVDVTVSENIAAINPADDLLHQYVIPASERGRALQELRLMNITRTSLFPGLEGFAQSFRQLPVREPHDQRVLRLALGHRSSSPVTMQMTELPAINPYTQEKEE